MPTKKNFAGITGMYIRHQLYVYYVVDYFLWPRHLTLLKSEINSPFGS